jgi:hypothetical protein
MEEEQFFQQMVMEQSHVFRQKPNATLQKQNFCDLMCPAQELKPLGFPEHCYW